MNSNESLIQAASLAFFTNGSSLPSASGSVSLCHDGPIVPLTPGTYLIILVRSAFTISSSFLTTSPKYVMGCRTHQKSSVITDSYQQQPGG